MRNRLLTIVLLLAALPCFATKTLTSSVAFTDATGHPYANGYLTFQLQGSARAILGGQVVSGSQVVKINLDSNGMVLPGQTLWGNDELTPTGTYYSVAIKPAPGSGQGGRAAENWILAGTSPIDLAFITNSTLPDPGLSNPVLQNPVTAQTITGQPLTIASNLTTGVGSASGKWTFTAGIQGSLNGAINPQDYGAKCDGSTDDTTAFQNAINAAFPNTGGSAHSLVIPATGQACVVTQLNLTNINNQINIQGQNSISGFQAIIWCRESTSNSKVCIDFSGSQYITIHGVDFYGGTSTANAPRVTVLLAKTSIGNSQIIHWDDVTVEGYGDYQVYNYGGEVWNCYYCSFFQHGTAGVDLVRLTSTNSVGITSPFATIGVGNVSMTKVNLWGTWSAGGTTDGVAIESSALPISQVTIGGFGNLNSASSFIRDTGTGEIHGLDLHDLRVEPTCTNCGLLSLSNTVSNLVINAQWAAVSSPSVTLVNLAGQVNIADMTLRPGDGQSLFPSVNVITCSAGVIGVVIRDFIKLGGGSQNNSCPGAVELGGVGGLFTEGATGGDQGNGTINLTNAYYINGAKVGTIASGTAAMTTALIAAGACGSTVTVAASGVATTDAIQHSFNASIGANPGVLIVQSWPTANNVNFAYCNPTAGGVTPSAATLNWRVVR